MSGAPRLSDFYRRRYRGFFFGGVLALLAVDLLDVALPLALKAGFDALQSADPIGGARTAALVYLGMAGCQAALRLTYRRSLAYCSISIARDLRDRVVGKTLRLPFAAARGRPVGEILTLTSSDAENAAAPFDIGLIMLMDALIYLLAVPLIMTWIAPDVTLIVILPIFALPLLMRRGETLIRSASHEVQRSVSEVSSDAHEAVAGIETVKAFAQEEPLTARFSRQVRELKRNAVRLAEVESATGARLEALSTLSTALLLLFGGGMLAAGELSLGTFVALQRYLQLLTWPTQALSFWIGVAQRGRAGEERIGALLDLSEEPSRAASRSDSAPAIEVRGLTFTYPGAATPVLNGISFSIAPGETIALLGGNASGKTTLLSLLARLYDPPPGTVFVGGRDVLDFDVAELRAMIGAVLQDPFLFSGTLGDNIDDATSLPLFFPCGELGSDPLSREVHEAGHGLSGGQRQRITVARALGRAAPIMLLDDPLSAVDLHTESRLVPVLRGLLTGKTALLVTQRLPAIALADSVIVLQEGAVTQRGTVQELLRDEHGWFALFHRRHTLLSQITGASPTEAV